MSATAKRAKDVRHLEQRLEDLEKQFEGVLRGIKPDASTLWWKRILGKFENDPIFDEVVKEIRKRRRAEYAALKVAPASRSRQQSSTRKSRRRD
jgi:hypothetical protein